MQAGWINYDGKVVGKRYNTTYVIQIIFVQMIGINIIYISNHILLFFLLPTVCRPISLMNHTVLEHILMEKLRKRWRFELFPSFSPIFSSSSTSIMPNQHFSGCFSSIFNTIAYFCTPKSNRRWNSIESTFHITHSTLISSTFPINR